MESTAARTLLESVLLRFINEADHDFDGNLPKIYKQFKKEYSGFDPSKQSNQMFKQVLSGLNDIVCGISGIRNKIGDSHGKHIRQAKHRISKHHAEFAVNSCLTFINFIIGSIRYQKRK